MADFIHYMPAKYTRSNYDALLLQITITAQYHFYKNLHLQFVSVGRHSHPLVFPYLALADQSEMSAGTNNKTYNAKGIKKLDNALGECRPPWPRKIITPILHNVENTH